MDDSGALGEEPVVWARVNLDDVVLCPRLQRLPVLGRGVQNLPREAGPSAEEHTLCPGKLEGAITLLLQGCALHEIESTPQQTLTR